jgi:hypothetical protein
LPLPVSRLGTAVAVFEDVLEIVEWDMPSK